MTKKFTIKEAFFDGFDKMKKYWFIVLGAGALTVAVSMLFEIVNNVLTGGKYSEPSILAVLLSLVVSLASAAFSILTSYNMMKMLFKMHDGTAAKVMDVFHYNKKDLKKIGYWFLASLLYGAVVFLGLICLIIPGIYLAIRYGFALYLMIDKDMGIKESFHESAKMTKGQIWHIIGFGIASFFAIVLGLLLLVVGLIPAYIIVMFANIYVYRKLAIHHATHHTDHHHTDSDLNA